MYRFHAFVEYINTFSRKGLVPDGFITETAKKIKKKAS
jgi:hypothetical protein